MLQFTKERSLNLSFQSGVSLHSHTRHSKESLGFIGEFLKRHRYLQTWIERQRERCKRATGIILDFDQAYWTPPLCEVRAHALESRQIQQLGLRPLISLSDHDTIAACALLRQYPALQDFPQSVEWTVPFGRAVFHVGVHNIPSHVAESCMLALKEATATANERRIHDLLAELCRIPSILLVFNHPEWNMNGIPGELFTSELKRFLKSANCYLHAFEVNGMRSHQENRAVIRLASKWDQIIVSGGDRHGSEPNAFLNLTNAADFSEFVEEVRKGKQSTVLVMPQYEEPLNWRFYQNFTQVIVDYPEYPEGRRRWDERTFHPDQTGKAVRISELWHAGPPGYLKAIFAAAHFATKFPMGGVLREWTLHESHPLTLPASSKSDLRPGNIGERSIAASEEHVRHMSPSLTAD